MSEWWSYGLSDFLMFSPAAYQRLFERYNAALWPAQLVALAAGLALLRLGPRAACGLLAAAWLWVAWAFHWQRYAPINWAAEGYALAFALQGLLLAWTALRAAPPPGPAPRLGRALLWYALLLQPLLPLASGRSWQGLESFGLCPDPSVAATLALLLMHRLPWPCWIAPLLWCAVEGATLWTLKAPQAFALPALALLALAAAFIRARR
jgi:hypothetical protein